MDPLSLILLVLAVAALFWLLNRINMDPGLRNILYIVAAVVVFLWLLQALGVWHWPQGSRVLH
jgi:hypothetical protein